MPERRIYEEKLVSERNVQGRGGSWVKCYTARGFGGPQPPPILFSVVWSRTFLSVFETIVYAAVLEGGRSLFGTGK